MKAGDLVRYLSRVVLILGPGRKRGWWRGIEVGTDLVREYNSIALRVME